ncbi:tetratricopeptide repeat protein [Kitasatospora sp. NPDC057692]|uniref:tetratricopeptide repeat protein n=1 Tax=Kitasatospora sp. NPDC057692 TaxID=3346215 RepID=UPI00367C522C
MTPPSVPLRPLVSRPDVVEPGRSYLVTVDVEIAGEGPLPDWPYDQEEFAIGCVLSGCPGIEIEALGSAAVVLHRYGGTYGPARFVAHVAEDLRLTDGVFATGAGGPGLQLTLVTAGGIPFRTVELPIGLAPDVGGPAEEPPTVPLRPRARRTVAPVAPEPEAHTRSGRPDGWPRGRVVGVTVPVAGSSGAAYQVSGHEIAPGLVLTALPDRPYSDTVVEVYRTAEDQWLGGYVVWTGTGKTLEGIALIRLDDRAPALAPAAATVRWGRLVTDSVTTECRVAWADTPFDRRPDSLRSAVGTLRPAGPRSERSIMTLGFAPGNSFREAVAGCAVFCGDLLTGVVTSSHRQRADFVVVPSSQLLADPSFRDTLLRHLPQTVLFLEPVEWLELADAFPARPRSTWSTPAALLQARYQVLPYRGRAAELARLRDWAREPGADVRLIHGAGGQGKTRLAQELINLLNAEGWAPLWLRAAAAGGLDRLTRAAAPTLIVVDYAEARADQLRALLRIAADRERSGLPFRLLLLARTAGDWWHALATTGPAVAGLLDRAEVVALPPWQEESDVLPEEEYVRAVRGFATELSRVPGWEQHDWPHIADRLVDPSRLDGHLVPGADRTLLALHMTALADLLDTAEQLAHDSVDEEPALRPEELEDRLLSHEQRYWYGLADASRLRHALSMETLRSALAVAFLFGAEDRTEADELLNRVPALADQSRDRRDAVRSWISAVSPSTRSRPWEPLQPDRLAERFVGRRLVEDPALVRHIVPGASAAQIAQLLTVYARAATHRVFGNLLNDGLTTLCVHHADVLGPAAVEAVTWSEAPEPLLEALELITAAPDLPLAELERLARRLPKQSERLASWAVRLTRRLVTEYRALAESDPRQLPRLAEHLNDLGLRLTATGRHEEALSFTSEAIDLWRRLAETTPDPHLPGLGRGLNNLGISLSAVGRFDEALSVTAEAVNVRRRLGETDPDAYRPDLAAALSNLGSRLATMGRHEEALASSREAVQIYRHLAEGNPDAFLPDLAGSLVNLAGELGQLGRHGAALEAAAEAVGHYRRLADSNPDAYLPNLANGLDSLAIRLADVGRHEEALHSSTEAVSIRRALAAANPAAHLPDLARSLHNLALGLDQADQRTPALDAMAEAVSIHRSLAKSNPAAFLLDLGMSLNNLSVLLGRSGEATAALDAAQEAVALYRRLATLIPAAFLPGLGTSLVGLMTFLSDLGRLDEALAASHEAVRIRYTLASSDAQAGVTALSTALRALARRLEYAGRTEEASETLAVATEIGRAESHSVTVRHDARGEQAVRATVWHDHGGSSAN